MLHRVNTSGARDWKRYPTAELNPTSDRRLPPKSDPVARAKGIAGKDAPYQHRTPVARCKPPFHSLPPLHPSISYLTPFLSASPA